MERKIILTGDGSHSIAVPELNVAYHSVHGAIEESMHVFINTGFYEAQHQQSGAVLKIFEVGLGTGLNALLTFIEAERDELHVYYETVEPFPISQNDVAILNYCQQLNRPDLQPIFENIHNSEWEIPCKISAFFSVTKWKVDLRKFSPCQPFNLIYFDAFAPNGQPELWTKEVFDKMYAMLEPGGILVTYCSKGEVRRSMLAAGFQVEKLPGPPKKREMIRAVRPGPSRIH